MLAVRDHYIYVPIIVVGVWVRQFFCSAIGMPVLNWASRRALLHLEGGQDEGQYKQEQYSSCNVLEHLPFRK